jgi:hypothetical protein
MSERGPQLSPPWQCLGTHQDVLGALEPKRGKYVSVLTIRLTRWLAFRKKNYNLQTFGGSEP